MRLGPILLLALISATQAPGVPVISPPVNQASFFPPALPQYGIAQGAMFALFGQEMGPARLTIVDAFPLSTDLAGTSVQVRVNGTVRDCLMVFTSARQLAVILPSDTPTGEGTITVTFNGETSEPAPILVVSSAVGIFTQSQSGQGPGIFTNTNFEINKLTKTFRVGDAVIAWVTGLGPRDRDDMPMPEDLKDRLNLRVLVGGIEAKIIYAGPSGCCGGVDQIVFEVPAPHQGCFVPVVILVDESVSNYATMSVSPDGGTCSDEHGLLASEIDRLVAEGPLALVTAIVSTSVVESVDRTAALGTGRLPAVSQDASFTSLSVRVKPEITAPGVNVPQVPFVIPEDTCIAEWEVFGQTGPAIAPNSAALVGLVDFLLEDSSRRWEVALSEDNFYSATSILGDTVRLGEGGQITAAPQAGFGIDGMEPLSTAESWGAPLGPLDLVESETQKTLVEDTWQLNDKWSFNLGVRYDENEGEKDMRAMEGEQFSVEPRLGFVYELKGRLIREDSIQTKFSCLWNAEDKVTLDIPSEIWRSMRSGPGDGSNVFSILPKELPRFESESSSGFFRAQPIQNVTRFVTGLRFE